MFNNEFVEVYINEIQFALWPWFIVKCIIDPHHVTIGAFKYLFFSLLKTITKIYSILFGVHCFRNKNKIINPLIEHFPLFSSLLGY